ncbi:hypothetical protein [Sulfitobacter sp. JL08]|uniref:hypothetical protein n=1 Tax=Sulfitobacter sp. JL08 TaxID=2070369 RepID=UPI0026C23AB4
MRSTALRDHIGAIVLNQRGFLFPWVPVCLAAGIAVYFALRFEPPVWVYVPARSFRGVPHLPQSAAVGSSVRWCGRSLWSAPVS